jgi:hypothetical protein
MQNEKNRSHFPFSLFTFNFQDLLYHKRPRARTPRADGEGDGATALGAFALVSIAMLVPVDALVNAAAFEVDA